MPLASHKIDDYLVSSTLFNRRLVTHTYSLLSRRCQWRGDRQAPNERGRVIPNGYRGSHPYLFIKFQYRGQTLPIIMG